MIFSSRNLSRLLVHVVGQPDRIIRVQTHKPAEQQVVVRLLQQQPLRADPVERLQGRDIAAVRAGDAPLRVPIAAGHLELAGQRVGKRVLH